MVRLMEFLKDLPTWKLSLVILLFPILFILVFLFVVYLTSDSQSVQACHSIQACQGTKFGIWLERYHDLLPGWLSAITAIFGSFIGSLIVLQLYFSAQQMRRERESKEYEYFKRLAELDMMRIRRFVYNDEFQSSQEKFKKNIENGIEIDEALNLLRTDVHDISTRANYIVSGEELLQLDHIEYAINYYNFMCKMIIDKSISSNFGTKLGTANFRGFYTRVKSFIEARAAKSANNSYAVHFKDYVNPK